jgi:hypothetical protein
MAEAANRLRSFHQAVRFARCHSETPFSSFSRSRC